MADLEAHQLINANSGDTEIYSPPEIVDAWHEVLGGPPDLDPASTEVANRCVRAKQIFTAPEFTVDGEIGGRPVRRYHDWGALAREWNGKTVLNPPFGTPECACEADCSKKRCEKRGWHTATDLPGMPHWVNHFIGEYKGRRMTEGLMICFAATSEGWFKPLKRYPICLLDGRTNYMLPDGSRYQGATKGSCVTYVGPNVKRFAEVFGKLGEVKISFDPESVVVPIRPPRDLLYSMALRHDHAFGTMGLSDEEIERLRNSPDALIAGQARMWRTTAEREAMLSHMAQLHEEVVGTGFYRYAA